MRLRKFLQIKSQIVGGVAGARSYTDARIVAKAGLKWIEEHVGSRKQRRWARQDVHQALVDRGDY